MLPKHSLSMDSSKRSVNIASISPLSTGTEALRSASSNISLIPPLTFTHTVESALKNTIKRAPFVIYSLNTGKYTEPNTPRHEVSSDLKHFHLHHPLYGRVTVRGANSVGRIESTVRPTERQPKTCFSVILECVSQVQCVCLDVSAKEKKK